MSLQLGTLNVDGTPVSPEHIDTMTLAIKEYPADQRNCHRKNNVFMLYAAFYTAQDDRTVTQPHVSKTGAVITWDGRLDNRAELAAELNIPTVVADAEIVATAYDRFQENCFRKFLGDWAVAIWRPDGSLLLARDFSGIRPLYYAFTKQRVSWSTVLDPLLMDKPLELNQEYIAGWLTFCPAAHLSPYIGVEAVPPSCFVYLIGPRRIITRYWQFDPGLRIRYSNDTEYEEHFRAVFQTAVQRRLRSDRPVLAELSGGMDSSSIVCTADTILNSGRGETPRLDTLSYFDDTEPNWNESVFFAVVEKQRGRRGFHIDVSSHRSYKFGGPVGKLAVSPDLLVSGSSFETQFAECLASNGYRVVLSGVGGDETTGGVPTPLPELEDLIARGRVCELAHKLKVWALEKRKPWFHLFLEALRAFLPVTLVRTPRHLRPAEWFDRAFSSHNANALAGYASRLKLSGPLPTFQENLSTFELLRRQLASQSISFCPHYEKRYPYLDRDFLEFMFAVPREQVVRPGQRRSLMRRSLAGIVPAEILHRRRKAFMARTPITSMTNDWATIEQLSNGMVTTALGIVDSRKFAAALELVRENRPSPIVFVERTLQMEAWLRVLLPQMPTQTLRHVQSFLQIKSERR